MDVRVLSRFFLPRENEALNRLVGTYTEADILEAKAFSAYILNQGPEFAKKDFVG